MSARVRKCLPFIKLVVNTSKVSTTLTRRLLADASGEQALAVIELIVNVLGGGLKVSSDTRLKLSKSKGILRKLAGVRRPSLAPDALCRHSKTAITFLRLCYPYIRRVVGKALSVSDNSSDSSSSSDNDSDSSSDNSSGTSSSSSGSATTNTVTSTDNSSSSSSGGSDTDDTRGYQSSGSSSGIDSDSTCHSGESSVEIEEEEEGEEEELCSNTKEHTNNKVGTVDKDAEEYIIEVPGRGVQQQSAPQPQQQQQQHPASSSSSAVAAVVAGDTGVVEDRAAIANDIV